MWINSGASDPYQVGQVQQLNNKPYLNSLTQIYDGSQISSQPVNPWAREVALDGISNGLQYAPQTDGGSVKSYDSLYQRYFEYESSGDELLEGA